METAFRLGVERLSVCVCLTLRAFLSGERLVATYIPNLRHSGWAQQVGIFEGRFNLLLGDWLEDFHRSSFFDLAVILDEYEYVCDIGPFT